VTSGGIRCSKGTPITKNLNPSLFIKGGTTKEKKSWHWTNIWPWVLAQLDAKSDRAGWLPAVSYCSALLCIDRSYPCGGRVEYLHRDPASRKRRRTGKSQIWDSKIWSRVPRDSDLRKTALAKASSMYKRQTRPLVREGAPQKQDRNCQTLINIWSWAPDGARHQDLLTDWPSVAMWLWL
jgi:hypothetical protein